MLAERQLSAITTRDLARTAEVSEGVLYNYFTDKNDLLITALVRRFNRMVTRYQTEIPPPGSRTVPENLYAFGNALLDLIADALPTGIGLIGQPKLLHRFFADIHSGPNHPALYHQRIVEYLRAEQDLGRVAATARPEATATLLAGGVAMLVMTNLVRGDQVPTLVDPHVQLSDLLETLVPGLIQEPNQPPSGPGPSGPGPTE